MDAAAQIRAGNLSQALEDLQAVVRREPSEPKHRIFLFQVLCLTGQWDRAKTQLGVIEEMSQDASSMVRTYRTLLAAESVRTSVFRGQKSPIVFGEPSEWIAWLIESVRLGATGHFEQAAELRGRAFDAAPTTSGRIGEQPFTWIADADSRFGPMLEAVVNGRYCWIPFHRLSAIRIEAPTDLRDFVWAPASLTYTTGGDTVAFIPTRYPGTEAAADPLRLARRTEWQEKPGDTFLGLGQRILATDAGEYPLLEVRDIQLAPAAAAG